MTDADDLERGVPWDVVVVGGGIAGMVAAVGCAELGGQRVIVLESGSDPLYRCNSRYTGGAFHVCFHDVAEKPQALSQAIVEATDGFADPELAVAVGSDAAAAVTWLRQQGVRFMRAGPDGWRQNFLAPPSLMQPGLHWQGRGGDVMLRTLLSRLQQFGGAQVLGARARKLLMEGDRCKGVEVELGGRRIELQTPAVVLCDGGFQANLDLLREYVSPAPEKLKQRGAATGQGDALLMARDAGAALAGMENIYGHLLCQDALQDDKLWPYPILDLISGASLVVDATGRRFMDEGLGGVYMTNCVARLTDPLSATVVFDRAIWEGPATEFILPANPHLVLAGGTVMTAATLGELSAKLELPAGQLERTITEYNAAIESDQAGNLTPARTVAKTKPWPVKQAPFLAVRLAAGVTYTMGGIAIDEHGRVLDTALLPIPGLYASGCCTGGLDGGPACGYVGGLTKSAVMSLRVAKAIARAREHSAARPMAAAVSS